MHPLGRLILLGTLFGGLLGMTGYVVGISLAGTTRAQAITACYPLIAALCGIFFLKERLEFRLIFAVVTVVVGVLLCTFTLDANQGIDLRNAVLGSVFALLAVLGWSAEGILSTKAMDRLDPDIAIGIREGFSGLCLLILFALFTNTEQLELIGSLDPYLYALPVLAGCVGGISYFYWYNALAIIGVSRGMALNITFVIWTIPFTYFLSGTIPDWTTCLGAGLIFVGALSACLKPADIFARRSKGHDSAPYES